MANISWTSSSINSFFNTSLGNPSSNFSGIYNSLSDSSLIKSGVYGKLMNSYYDSLKASSETTSNTTTEATTKKESSRTSTVMDELLSHETKESVVSNNIIDKLIASKKDSASCTYDSTGSKTQAAESTIDQSI